MHLRVQDLISSATISYAQNREDLILNGFFNEDKKGFYVDVGANDPNSDSVTRYFYDRGWSGINIEPIKSFHEKLETERPRDINLNMGVSDETGELTFREYPNHGRSTFSSTISKAYEEQPDALTDTFREYTVPVKPLGNIFAEYGIHEIQFLKVDVEGFEYEVLKGNDWKKYRPAVICIESNHIVKDWRPLLKDHDYTLAYSDGLNGYYVDKKQQNKLKEFSYVESVVMREPIVSYALLPSMSKRVDEANTALGQMQQKLNEFEAESNHKDEQILALERTIDAITPLRRHLKRQLRFWLGRVDHAITNRLAGDVSYRPQAVAVDVSKDLLQQAQQADAKAFELFAQDTEQPFMLRAYIRCRRATFRAAKSVLRIVRK